MKNSGLEIVAGLTRPLKWQRVKTYIQFVSLLVLITSPTTCSSIENISYWLLSFWLLKTFYVSPLFTSFNKIIMMAIQWQNTPLFSVLRVLFLFYQYLQSALWKISRKSYPVIILFLISASWFPRYTFEFNESN